MNENSCLDAVALTSIQTCMYDGCLRKDLRAITFVLCL